MLQLAKDADNKQIQDMQHHTYPEACKAQPADTIIVPRDQAAHPITLHARQHNKMCKHMIAAHEDNLQRMQYKEKRQLELRIKSMTNEANADLELAD